MRSPNKFLWRACPMQRPDHYDTSSSELLYSTQLHQHHTCAPTFNSRSPLAGQEALLHSSNCTTTHNCFHTMLHGHHQPHLCPSLLLQLPLKIEQEASITTAHFTITVSSWCQPHLRPDLELQLPPGETSTWNCTPTHGLYNIIKQQHITTSAAPVPRPSAPASLLVGQQAAGT